MLEMLTERIEKEIKKGLEKMGFRAEALLVDRPKVAGQGDYATSIALSLGKKENKNPLEIAKKLKEQLEKNTGLFTKIEVVPPGFINFFIQKKVFVEEIATITEAYGKSDTLAGQKIIIEYTDPNPFKEFHIGHLMSNAIGESISRLIEWQGAEVKRACYQGDVGLHVAKALWSEIEVKSETRNDLVHGRHYARGNAEYEKDPKVQEEVKEINKKIYERSDPHINTLYEEGKKLSLEYFEAIYKKLGTRFDFYFFESESGSFGKKTVEEGIEKGVFEKSDGAVVFRGENEGLHTRVFINSEGLPTYEAKELGLAKIKYNKYPYDSSVVITGNEVNEYFRVVTVAMEKIFPDLAEKTKHISHGMLRLPSGKMSSRTGDVITASDLLEDVKKKILEKVDSDDRPLSDKERVVEEVSIGAIKYSMLRQAPGRDAIFDLEKSISFLGDSGPYLQYAHARACSVLEKAKRENIEPEVSAEGEVYEIEKVLALFPAVVLRAGREYAPQYLVTYLTELAGSFNAHYAKHVIVDTDSKESPYHVALTESFVTTMKNGLWLLGMESPERM